MRPAKQSRVCVVGAGMFSGVHLEAWASVPNVQVVALCDPDAARRNMRAEASRIARDCLFVDLGGALERSVVDVVDIVTPIGTHRKLVEQAAAAGKHILCQKPLAPSLQDARAIISACEASGVRIMVAEAFRWRAHYMKIKEILISGILGDVHFAKISAKSHFSPRWHDSTVLMQPFLREMDRLLIQEMGPHWFDVYLHLFGDPRSIKCSYRRVSPYAKGEDLVVVVFEHESMIGLLDASWASRELIQGRFNRHDGVNTMDNIVIDGADATLRLDANGVMEIIRGRDLVERVEYGPGEYIDAHKRLHRHFIDCLQRRAPFATSGRDTLRALELIDAAYAMGATRP